MSAKSHRIGTLLGFAILASSAALFVAQSPRYKDHTLEFRTYFQDAQGLRRGAPVRLAGVDVGTVTSVHARPEFKDHPAEVTLSLHTPYVLHVPADATVSLESAGILGPTLAEIDVRNASGAPISNGGVLKSVSLGRLSTEQLLDRVTDALANRATTSSTSEKLPSTSENQNGTHRK